MAKDRGNTSHKKVEPLGVVKACVVILVGILFCLSRTMSDKALSNSLGAALIVVGVLYCVLSVVKEKSLLTAAALGGFLAAALGVYVISVNAVGLIFTFVPYLLIAYGVLLIADAFMGKFWRETDNTFVFVCKLLFGVAAIGVSVCLLTIDKFAAYASLVLGVVIIVLGVYFLVKSIEKTKSRASK